MADQTLNDGTAPQPYAMTTQQMYPYVNIGQTSGNFGSPVMNDSGYTSSPNSSYNAMPPPPLPSDEGDTHQIPGRLGLLNDNRSYLIPIEELGRRLNAPENLNISYINGILRRAKGRAGAVRLRNMFDRYGIRVPHNKRTDMGATCFTPLAEEEAIKLSKDFAHIMGEHFDLEPLEEKVKSKMAQNMDRLEHQVGRAIESIFNPSMGTDHLAQLMTSFGAIYQDVLMEDRSLDFQKRGQSGANGDALQKSFWNLNMATHNYGVPALQSTINAVCRIPAEPQPQTKEMF